MIAIAAGTYHSMALRADGTVLVWGSSNFGVTNIPAGLSNVVAISASGGHCTALRSDGSVVYWGGYLTFNTSGTVVLPNDLGNVIQVADFADRSVCIMGTRVPSITISPVSRTVLRGTNIMLVAKASAAQPVSYQWQQNGLAISGATSDTLTLTNLQFSQSGAYQLVVSNRYGVTASKAAKITVSLPLDTAMDTTGLTWTTTGALPWIGQADITHDGVDAVRSGAITHGQETILQTSVSKSGGGQISFWWKVSSETFFDTLEFRINGVLQASISGEVDWEQRTFLIGSSTNLLQWRYSKDANGTVGQDAAWVDQLLVVPNPPVITRSPLNVTAQMGATVQFSPVVSGTGPFTYQWWKDQTNAVGGNTFTLTLNNVGRTDRGLYSVTVANAGGSVTSSNALLTVLIPQQFGTAILRPDGTFQFTSGYADGGTLTDADLARFELQVSTNLASWTALTNSLSITNGTLLLFDADQTNFASRYYRIIEY